jgi:hypothetical protein
VDRARLAFSYCVDIEKWEKKEIFLKGTATQGISNSLQLDVKRCFNTERKKIYVSEIVHLEN